jgi:PIN domain nuclease of toxin-antitoxin system
MKLLLDTHAFLWFIEDSPRLSAEAKGLLESDVDLFISVASLWEIAIKLSTGKLTLTQQFEAFISEQLSKNTIEVLPITVAHLALVATLPFHHRDPFDRLLIAQATVELLPIVSIDQALDHYRIKRLW